MRYVSDVDEVLSTTRTVRFRLDFERPVEDEILEECLSLAQQATMGSNQEEWRVNFVRDPSLKLALAELYRDTYEVWVAKPLREDPAARKRLSPSERDDEAAVRRQARVMEGVKYLADNLERVPVLSLFSTETPPPPTPVGKLASGFYGGIFPMIWSFQLAARSRGLGTVMATGAVHHAKEMADLLDLPSSFTVVCLVPVSYSRGIEFRRAARRPLQEIYRYDRWTEGTTHE